MKILHTGYYRVYLCFLWVFVMLATSACVDQHPQPLPIPPSKLEVITEKVPVPVLCKAQVTRSPSPLDSFGKGQALEIQNAMLRETIATLSGYIKRLEGGVTGCGGTIESGK